MLTGPPTARKMLIHLWIPQKAKVNKRIQEFIYAKHVHESQLDKADHNTKTTLTKPENKKLPQHKIQRS